MFELPLFPLNTVLYPSTSINLHVFEDRYKEMINTCIETRKPFGVVLIREGIAELGPLASPHSIGCSAQIVRVQPLGQGRMDISAVGQERFRIEALHHDKPYLVGTVENMPIENKESQAAARAGRRLRLLIIRYLGLLAKTENIEFDPKHLPTDPVELAYLGVTILQQLPLSQKQNFLETSQAIDLVQGIGSVYYREVTLLEMMMTRSPNAGKSFSLN